MLLAGYVLLWGIACQHAWLVNSHTTWPIYAVWFLIGLARGFIGPSIFAFMTQLVPKKLYANSSTWNSSVFHFASMAGPALGGLVYGFVGVVWAFALPVLFALTSIVLIAPVAPRPMARSKKFEPFWDSLISGIQFVFKNQIMLAALALDMFAVLFGGVTALRPDREKIAAWATQAMDALPECPEVSDDGIGLRMRSLASQIRHELSTLRAAMS
jgi:MFS family permease